MLKKCRDFIELEGLCTHFAGAETFANDFKIQKQFDRFKEYYATCKKRGVMPKMRHLASSAAALSFAKSRFEMVRIGVAQYGFWPSPDVYYHHLNETHKRSEKGLRRIFSWKTDVMDVRFVDEGGVYRIRYGISGFARYESCRPAAGLFQWLPTRAFKPRTGAYSGKESTHYRLINMNLFMVDITHIPGVEVGDEVVLIGRQGNNQIGVASFTQTTQLRNQEMMSRLPAAIPRVAVR